MLKVITVRQPWASLVVHGIKTIETRPAPPNGPMRPPGVRGLPGLSIDPGERIGIHAAITSTPGSDPIWQAVADAAPWLLRKPFELGQLIGTVEVPEALPIVHSGEEGAVRTIDVDDDGSLWLVEPQTDAEAGDGPPEWTDISDQCPFGDFTPGRWAWRLANPEPCDPQPMRGRQGVWRADVGTVL